ncbi:MAG: NADH-quinone oxidoreductase subunit M [Armatimonadota bacterium]|nr:NADH-quinone oxidoreductase subunit M [Armatimonadota bacterium]MDR7451479.1 NADH-quinone oxidoreductase subunit M [Armatimonadota bacterium]MDR7467446.1 NADH-quinone oxidoreductase subunit M [Armatimonadota bacterium]MDR7494320.1 NADH-quinone oxidoreductase subunit M [Armatimonadota bacterium]MDR7499137.1 NADH-quinone oxidoreductase subunit M [Armatimonadota bacterium]
MLSLITFIPLAGGLLILLLPKTNHALMKIVALLAAAASFVLSLVLIAGYQVGGGMQFQELYQWIPAINVYYHLGVDGLSLPLLVLTTLLSLLSIVYSWRIDHRLKEYLFLFLLLETGMNGVFVALDFFLFYIFWEITLVPMYFLIAIWGGPRKEYAAIKFFLYTLVGSLAMLLAILLLYFNSDPRTFGMLELIRQQPLARSPLLAALAFWGFFLSFAIKVPMWPFHTWLPDAHVEAPTAGSVILAGILLKMGTYGFVRVSLPMLPEAFKQYAVPVAVLALLGIVYGALVAMAQTDLKKLVAYSSVNHMGYVMLGTAAAAAAVGDPTKAQAATTALNGAVFEMVAHGIITGALFLIVGVLYDYRAHTRGVDEFGGLGARLPVYTGITTMAMLASLGLPGLMGFVAEFLIFVGSFGVFPYLTAVAVTGVVFSAAMFLWTIQRIFLGPFNERWAHLPDMDGREKVALVPLAALMLIFGIYPRPLLDVINAAMAVLVGAVP